MGYPHVLSGVDLITDKGSILKKYGADATDNAQLHIRYTVQNGDITITDKDGKILPWMPVKEWKRKINNALEDTITFSDVRLEFIAILIGTTTFCQML